MRRSLAAVALVVVTAVTLAGCGKPAGVDGSLTNGWPAIGEPKPFVPAADTCHETFKETGYLSSYEPVDCAKKHESETAYVGTFADGDVDSNTPPTASSAAMKAAYAECAGKAKEYLGADWRSGRVYLGMVLPSTDAWSGGARWFRCDLMETVGKDDSDFVAREGSIKGALGGSRALGYTCYAVTLKNNSVDKMTPTACTKTHNAEFVGVYTAPDGAYKAPTSGTYDAYHKACRSMVAGWANVPNDGNTVYRYGTIVTPLGRTEWERGNRGVLCHIWLDKKNQTKSLKGAGTGALPIN
ncbi:septum formation family protein [Rhizomonospora bruguierae]|uniref:septum formation family protein n=1 Tax=Rhizomonospora bruguierae TaxID=1581705 RepID=UPI001BCA8FCA|nr:septum formation family protein [Micromonospora sp. NBRC 107566]